MDAKKASGLEGRLLEIKEAPAGVTLSRPVRWDVLSDNECSCLPGESPAINTMTVSSLVTQYPMETERDCESYRWLSCDV